MQGRPYPPQKNGHSDHELVSVSAHIHHEFYVEEFSSHLSLNELQASATHWVKPPKHVGASSSSKFLVTRPTMLYHVLPCVPTNHDIVTCDTVCQTAAVRRFAFSRSRSFQRAKDVRVVSARSTPDIFDIPSYSGSLTTGPQQLLASFHLDLPYFASVTHDVVFCFSY